MSAGPRVVLVGCGAIAAHHADALRAIGADLVAVAARPDSPRLAPFAENHEIDRTFTDLDELAAWDGWDAAVVAVSTDACADVLRTVADERRPILAEKPVAASSAAIGQLIADLPDAGLVAVAYNRRWYASVAAAAAYLEDQGQLLVTIEIPEAIRVPASFDASRRYARAWFDNSVHVLDLALHLLGDLELLAVARREDDAGTVSGLAALLRAASGTIVQLTGCWSAPANFAIELHGVGSRYALRPIELGTLFDGVEVHPPDREMPIKRYVPRAATVTGLADDDVSTKPGFVEQARELARRVAGDARDPRSASLDEAQAAVALAEALAGFTL